MCVPVLDINSNKKNKTNVHKTVETFLQWKGLSLQFFNQWAITTPKAAVPNLNVAATHLILAVGHVAPSGVRESWFVLVEWSTLLAFVSLGMASRSHLWVLEVNQNLVSENQKWLL